MRLVGSGGCAGESSGEGWAGVTGALAATTSVGLNDVKSVNSESRSKSSWVGSGCTGSGSCSECV